MHRHNSLAKRPIRFESLEDRFTPTPVLPTQGLAGTAIAASHNGGSQAVVHSPVFNGGTIHPTATAAASMPSTAGQGITTAASHNANSQAGAHSPIFNGGTTQQPSAAGHGITTAASHNANSQAGAHSPIFEV
jgi:hypothetical protein